MAQKPEPDVLLFNNGEKLIGKLLRSSGGSVTFHSDSAGDITVDWAKVKELKAAGQYAVVGKGTNLRKTEVDAIPQGKIAVQDQKILVEKKAGGTETIPVKDSGLIVEAGPFDKALTHQPGWLELWKGSVTAGASLVEATQASRTYNGALNLTRALPSESFLERTSRTVVNLSAAYGSTRQPGIASVKTEIIHADGEQDKYFSPRAYGFGQISFDHNYSQGLDLQQNYGAGIGLTAVKGPNEELNLKVSADYSKQKFTSGMDNNLAGSIFADTYTRKLGKTHSLLFQQALQLSPAWNRLQAYSATGSASLTAPVFRSLSFQIGVQDGFVNNPAAGFKKNSFQATTGLTYVLK